MSMPFVDRAFTFTQPDGTQFQVRGTGNQHQATFATLGGHTVMQDPVSRFYHFARPTGDHPRPSGVRVGAVDPAALGLPAGVKADAAGRGVPAFVSAGLPRSRSRWQVRREEYRMRALAATANGAVPLAPPQRETLGTFAGLCLLIDFPDEKGPLPESEVADFCNKKGYSNFGNNGSVHDYFFEVSDGKLTYTNIVAPWYTAKNPREYYTDPTIEIPIRARELILEALSYHRSKGFDFSGLTADNQHYIYAINVFYAGEVTNNWNEGLWPHSFHLQAPVQLASNRLANDYQITDMPPELSLGTFCHENCHMICDFPDLYDYGYESKGVGAYCLMCAGGNSDPKNPHRVGAYLRHAAGWSSKVTNMAPGASISLAANKNEFALLRRNKTQYFIVENRERSGRDATLSDAGLAIWKIDEVGNNSNEQMKPDLHYECSLIQADGNNDLEMGVNNGDGGDLYKQGGVFSATSHPSSTWWDGGASGLNIHNISAPGPIVSFST